MTAWEMATSPGMILVYVGLATIVALGIGALYECRESRKRRL